MAALPIFSPRLKSEYVGECVTVKLMFHIEDLKILLIWEFSCVENEINDKWQQDFERLNPEEKRRK
jgi:hypothetical protein